MSGLNSRAQALVDAIQFADEPSAADYDRIHDAIVARIAVGVIAGTALAVGTEAAASTVVSSFK